LLEPAVQASDSASGLASTVVEVSEDAGMWQRYDGALAVVDGRAYRFRARAADVAGNVSVWAYSPVVVGGPASSAGDDGDGVGGGSNPEPSPPAPGKSVEAGPRTVSAPAPPVVHALPPSTPVAQIRLVPLDPALRIVRTRATRRSVIVSGSTAPSYLGAVKVRLTARAKSTVKRADVRGGRWSVTLRRPARGRVKVVVTAPAVGPFGAAERARTLR